MDKPDKSFSVEECNTEAAILLKTLSSDDAAAAKLAAKRLQHLPELAQFSQDEIVHAKIQLKHALAVIAIEKGFTSWTELKVQLPFVRGGFINKWFANYGEAKSHQQSAGGFLLPYQKQFFICDEHYITQLGFDPHDPDWKLIGYDWEKPSNQTAWLRLSKKWAKIQERRRK